MRPHGDEPAAPRPHGVASSTAGPPAAHLERWRILRRFFCRRRVRFFFHFHRNIERAFLYGLDLCAIAAGRRGAATAHPLP